MTDQPALESFVGNRGLIFQASMRQGHIHPSLEDPPDHGWEEALNSIQAGRISSRPWAMIYIGVDIHRNKSQVAALDREEMDVQLRNHADGIADDRGHALP